MRDNISFTEDEISLSILILIYLEYSQLENFSENKSLEQYFE
jgi:hypothetical protein